MGRLIPYIFYNHCFYGLCAVALIWETSVQLGLGLDEPYIYAAGYSATVLFYNYPYLSILLRTSDAGSAADPRLRWIRAHRKSFQIQQIIWVVVFLIAAAALWIRYGAHLSGIPASHWIMILSIPLLGAAYYNGHWFRRRHTLRQVGWLKPFVIGLVWTGVVFVYPILFTAWIRPERISPGFFMALLFIKSVMYISVLAILFDAKDIMIDRSHQVKTLVVRMGVRQTLLYLLLPMALLGTVTFITYAIIQGITGWRMVLTLIPFVLLVLTIWSLRRERSLLYYLIVVDGLMLIKACCGILAMQ